MSVPEYSVAIGKGAALNQETRLLLKLWQPGMAPGTLTERALADGGLGGRSAYRINDIVNRVFVRRLLRPDDLPVRVLRRTLDAGIAAEVFNELSLVYSSRADHLLRDFVASVYWGGVSLGRTYLRVEDALAFVEDLCASGRIEGNWSDPVRVKVARGLVGALRDFGLLAPTLDKGRRRAIVKTRVSDWTVGILARELEQRGLSTGEALHSPDWSVLGLNASTAAERLEEAAAIMGATVQRAGEVVNVSWNSASVEEMIDHAA